MLTLKQNESEIRTWYLFSSKGSAMEQSFLPYKFIDINAVVRLIYPGICRILREDWVLQVRQLFWQTLHQFTSLVCQSFSQIHQSSESCQDWHGKNLYLSINRKCAICKTTRPVNTLLQVLKWHISAGKHPFIFQFKDEKLFSWYSEFQNLIPLNLLSSVGSNYQSQGWMKYPDKMTPCWDNSKGISHTTSSWHYFFLCYKCNSLKISCLWENVLSSHRLHINSQNSQQSAVSNISVEYFLSS